MATRLFWRRFFALIVDWVLASLVALALVYPFLGNTDRIRLSGGLFTLSQCQNVTSVPQEALDMVAPAPVAAAAVCQVWVYGIDNGLTLTLVYDRTQTANTSFSRSISFAVDAQGRPVAPLAPDGLLTCALLVLIGGALLARSGRTPGKALLRLRVTGPLTLPRALLREGMRLALPILANLLILSFASRQVLGVLGHLSAGRLIGGILACLVISALYYLLPLIRWRGAMPWDRLAGTHVTRA